MKGTEDHQGQPIAINDYYWQAMAHLIKMPRPLLVPRIPNWSLWEAAAFPERPTGDSRNQETRRHLITEWFPKTKVGLSGDSN